MKSKIQSKPGFEPREEYTDFNEAISRVVELVQTAPQDTKLKLVAVLAMIAEDLKNAIS